MPFQFFSFPCHFLHPFFPSPMDAFPGPQGVWTAWAAPILWRAKNTSHLWGEIYGRDRERRLRLFQPEGALRVFPEYLLEVPDPLVVRVPRVVQQDVQGDDQPVNPIRFSCHLV